MKLVYEGDKNNNKIPDIEEIGFYELDGDGDFASDECIELLKEADVVVTNPPFSLFRKFISMLMDYDKKFLVIGSMNAITYKETFKYIKENQLWLGNNYVKNFVQPNGEIKSFGNICWFTNLSHKKRQENIILFRKYNPNDYPQYDNYDAIEVSKVKDIPMDYDGVMGVPITFLEKWNPEQFVILSCNDYRLTEDIPFKEHGLIKDNHGTINGKPVYVRILIKNLNPQKEL
jgi:hypothetical protein